MPSKQASKQQKYVEHFAYINEKEVARGRTCIAAIKSFIAAMHGEIRGRFKNIPVETPTKKGKKTQTITVKEQQRADDEKYFTLSREYLAESRDAIADLKNWKIVASQTAPKTMRVYLGCVREFLEVNGKVVEDRKFRDVVKKFKGGEEAPQDAPKSSEIRSFLEHCDRRMEAITLLLSSTGCRISEIISLQEPWIDYDRRMITLPASVTKTKHGRHVFFSKEAEKSLSLWMRDRETYIEKVNKYSENFKDSVKLANDDGSIFPFDTTSINRAWNKTAKKAGKGKIVRGRMVLHPHALRAFYSSQMKRAGCPESIVEKLLGHTDAYGGAYDKYSTDDLQEAFETYSSAISIQNGMDVQKKVETLTLQVEAQTGKTSALEQELTALRAENAALKAAVNEVHHAEKKQDAHEAMFEEMKRRLDQLEKSKPLFKSL